jgi:hypothetical protein
MAVSSVSNVAAHHQATATDEGSLEGAGQTDDKVDREARPRTKNVRLFGPEWHHV